jgi:hypothetical protein
MKVPNIGCMWEHNVIGTLLLLQLYWQRTHYRVIRVASTRGFVRSYNLTSLFVPEQSDQIGSSVFKGFACRLVTLHDYERWRSRVPFWQATPTRDYRWSETDSRLPNTSNDT